MDAFGTAFDPASVQAHQTSLKYPDGYHGKAFEVRLLVVCVASLYTDRTRKQLVLDTIPAEWQAVKPGNMKAAFEELQKSRAKWTYFSLPPHLPIRKAPCTGKYKLGSNILLHNSDQESYLSYADYAVAMLDEIEDGTHIRERITAVSGRKRPTKTGITGSKTRNPFLRASAPIAHI